MACDALVCTMGIGLPLHWLEAAAATVVNAVGSLLFVGLDFKRPLWLAWVRALASALIISSRRQNPPQDRYPCIRESMTTQSLICQQAEYVSASQSITSRLSQVKLELYQTDGRNRHL